MIASVGGRRLSSWRSCVRAAALPRSSLLLASTPSSPSQEPFDGKRWLRQRPAVSRASEKIHTMDNPLLAKSWPPPEDVGDQISPRRCRDIMHHLHYLEIGRMKEKRPFMMPKIHAGDLVEVKYELSRSQQTFAVFQGFCVEVRSKWLNSSFVLKNTYDGVGVEQLIPRYSPRLLSVRVVRPLQPLPPKVDPRPMNRDYRNMWHNYARGKYSRGKRQLWTFWQPQRPGIMSLEPKLRRQFAKLRAQYQYQRQEAKLPPYIFPGPYNVTRRQTREVKAELYRRMLVYAWDERQQRGEKRRRLKERHKFGTYKMNKEAPPINALNDLPNYHPLAGNLPK
eukprot:TRINITY_DN81372_c0_g1_i1.p1 TRINITY_DN81372_c0_g1~~TRINITY_DN81372_c0_g1_i1.p1  ORF type:complete len:337 (-),score=64.13 TRINITY_DN81372_c0_g1_i1:165-1175(-)